MYEPNMRVRRAAVLNRSRIAVPDFPENMTILVTDIAQFGLYSNPEQLAVRQFMHTGVKAALSASGISDGSYRWEDRGDGVLLLIPYAVFPAQVLAGVLPRIVRMPATGARDRRLPPIRLRVGVHAGDVHRDGHGFVGADVNRAFRLVDSQELRDALRSTDKRCAVMISDALYQGIVCHRYAGIDPAHYHRVPVRTKEADVTGWLSIPGDDASARRFAAARQVKAPEPTAEATGGVDIVAGGNVSLRSGNIAGRGVTRRGWLRGRRG
jgi:class 3 adenylate cyclase